MTRYRWPDLSWLEGQEVPLPDDFLWGVANAGFQVEGGYNGPGEPENNWAEWERTGKAATSGQATRFWDRPERHLDLAAGLGLNAFRMSVEWTRLQPQPGGDLDPEALARYVDILTGARERGLEPMVTLQHFTHPAWLGADPWLDGSGPPAFEQFVGAVVPALGRALEKRGHKPVTWWITVNEPNIFTFATYGLRGFPHRAKAGPEAFRRALDQLLVAHVLAYRAIHRAYKKARWRKPKVTFNAYSMTAYPFDRGLLDLGRARAAGLSRGDFAEYLSGGRYHFEIELEPLRSQLVRRSDGWLERLLLPDLQQDLPGYLDALFAGDGPAHDFVAIDYYVGPISSSLRLPFTGSWKLRKLPIVAELWETTIRPEGLRLFLRGNRTDPVMPIVVVENGMATWRENGRVRVRPDGWTRPAFLRAHIAELVQAAKLGAPVAGYFHWTLTDNYEWGSYAPRFGLFGVDRSAGEPAFLGTDAAGEDAAGTYREIAKALRSGDGAAAIRTLSR